MCADHTSKNIIGVLALILAESTKWSLWIRYENVQFGLLVYSFQRLQQCLVIKLYNKNDIIKEPEFDDLYLKIKKGYHQNVESLKGKQKHILYGTQMYEYISSNLRIIQYSVQIG